jgi:hypothetical protein
MTATVNSFSRKVRSTTCECSAAAAVTAALCVSRTQLALLVLMLALLYRCCHRLISWSNIVAGTGPGATTKPSATTLYAGEFCVSDLNKKLLLANSDFIPYLISGLFLGADHPRASLSDSMKLWNQTMHAECFAQLALFPLGRDALRSDPSVAEALQTVATEGLSDKSRDFARAALMALSDEELQMRSEGQKHVMLSCECASCSQSNLCSVGHGVVVY